MNTFEIMHISGRRVVGSFQIEADSYIDADRKSEPERRKRGMYRYRIAKVDSESRPRHGGVHLKTFEWRNHPA